MSYLGELYEYRAKYPKNLEFDDELGMTVRRCDCAYLDRLEDGSFMCVDCGREYDSEEGTRDHIYRDSHCGVSRDDINLEMDEPSQEVVLLSLLDEIAKEGAPRDKELTEESPEYKKFWFFGGPVQTAMKFGMDAGRSRARKALDAGILYQEDVEWLAEMLKDDISLPISIRRTFPNRYYHWKRGEGVVSFQWKSRINKSDLTDYVDPENRVHMDVFPETNNLKEGIVWVVKKDQAWRFDSFDTKKTLNELKERAQKKGFHVTSRDVRSTCLRRFSKTPLYSRVRCQPEIYMDMAHNLESLI